MLLVPFEPALGAVDPDLDVVLVADRHLARPEHALGAALVAQQDVDVVIDLAAFDEGVDIGEHGIQLEAGDEGREIVGMGPDIADGAAARLFRIGAPGGLLLAGLLDRIGQPVLRILGLHDRGSRRARRPATICRACRTIG